MQKINNYWHKYSTVDAHFCESVSKNPYEGKPNEKQGPKAYQENQRAREVQRKKCKGKESVAEYKSAIEYKSAAEYNSLAGWLRQTKTNWAQDPFDPVNIIWLTKTQILLYKRIGMKNDMKKHDEKKQGTVGNVSSRNHVKERKAKPKENDKCSKKRIKK